MDNCGAKLLILRIRRIFDRDYTRHMKETLEVLNFGPIKHIKIDDIKPMTVLIGESGSGKSTIMKVLALFRWIYKMMSIRSYLKYSGVKKAPFRFRIESLIKTVGLESYLDSKSRIEYSNGSVKICVESKKLKGTSQYIPADQLSLEKISFIADTRNLVADILENKETAKRQYYLNETYEDYVKATDSIKSFNVDYLGVKLEVRKTPQGIKHIISSTEKGRAYDIKLSEASSGTKNIMPLDLIVEYYSRKFDIISSMNQAIFSYVTKADALKEFKAIENIGELKHKRVHLFIEEPKLSLFPDSQLSLMDFIVDRVVANPPEDYEMSLMIATHSPYIVNYLNVQMSRMDRAANKDMVAINEGQLDVYRVFEGELQPLLIKTSNDKTRVDASDLSEAMDAIAEEYSELN